MDFDSDDGEVSSPAIADIGEKGGLSSCGYWSVFYMLVNVRSLSRTEILALAGCPLYFFIYFVLGSAIYSVNHSPSW